MISDVNLLRNPSASRACTGFARVADSGQNTGVVENCAFHHRSLPDQHRRPKAVLHGIDSVQTKTSQRLNFIKKESAPLAGTHPTVPISTPSKWNSHAQAHLYARAARTIDDFWNAIDDICDLFTPNDCANHFAAAGYDLN